MVTFQDLDLIPTKEPELDSFWVDNDGTWWLIVDVETYPDDTDSLFTLMKVSGKRYKKKVVSEGSLIRTYHGFTRRNKDEEL